MLRLHDLLDHSAARHPRGELAVQGSRVWTYAQGLAIVNRLAQCFVRAGIAPGARIGVLLKNSFELVAACFAASKVGAVPVLLNHRLTAEDWAFALEDSESRLLFAGTPFLERLARVDDRLRCVEGFISIPQGPSRAPDAMRARWASFDAWTNGASADSPKLRVHPEDDALQLYTSGTTGVPKGVVLSHRAVVANVLQKIHMSGPMTGRLLMVAPLCHVAASSNAFTAVASGASLYLQEDFSPEAVVRAMSEDAIASALLVPAMLKACFERVPDVGLRRYPHLRELLYGGSPIQEQTLRRAIEVFRCELAQGYGSTEAGTITRLVDADHRRGLRERPEILSSAGRPTLGTEIRIVDPEGRSIPARQLGEVVVRGPQLMRGYYKRPALTDEVLRDGWLWTGDVGFLDEEGFLHIRDRIGDMIVSGGENVHPREIEDVLTEHPAILEAAAIGVPDEVWGETVKAIVVPRPGHPGVSEASLLDYCKDRLAGFKRPRSIEFVSELPKNANGKVAKRSLRERYWAGESRRVRGA